MKLKICGITQQENMLQVVELKPDFMGFIFYPASPRDVSTRIDSLKLEALPDQIKKVAVLVNMPLHKAKTLIQQYPFDLVQLHGNESPGYCCELKRHLPVIKVFRVMDSLPSDIQIYEEQCNYFLFDTRSEKPGGTGLSFDHSILQHYTSDNPYFVSGGIGPDFSFSDPHLPKPFALDINSRFEISPGIKNVDLLKNFVSKIRTNNI